MHFEPDAAKIRRWREERHWSQEHLADLAGIGTRTVQRIENGEAASKESVMALAAAFNVDVGALTVDPTLKDREDELKRLKSGLNALRLSFWIHLASYVFGMVVFMAISLSSGSDQFVMLIPAVWWTVGLAGHALTVAIVTLAAAHQSDSATG